MVALASLVGLLRRVERADTRDVRPDRRAARGGVLGAWSAALVALAPSSECQPARLHAGLLVLTDGAPLTRGRWSAGPVAGSGPRERLGPLSRR